MELGAPGPAARERAAGWAGPREWGRQLSCSDYSWLPLSHRAALNVISDLGFTGVDLGIFGEYTHLRAPEMCADPVRFAAAVRNDLDAVGLVAADVFFTPSYALDELEPTNPDKQDQERSLGMLRQATRFAQEMGVSGITLLPGVRRPGDSGRDALRAAAEGLRRRVDIVREGGLRASFEPHFESVADTVERAGDLVRAVPGLEITLDPAHLVFVGAKSWELSELAGMVRHVQLRAGGLGLMQARLPENEIDFGALLGALRQAGYDGWLAIEYVWMEKWASDRVDILTETRRFKEHISGLLSGGGLSQEMNHRDPGED